MSDDHYFDDLGRMVFTESYHLARGTCCGSGCRHCPYGNTSTRPRIVSLNASATEMVCALGARAQLVGISHECDTPETVKVLPRLTRPAFDVEVSSGEIDRQVREMSARQKQDPLNALSLYWVDVQALIGARPDIILTQSQCEVCAVSLDDVKKALLGESANLDAAVKLVSLNPFQLSDIWADILKVGRSIGRESEALLLIEREQNRLKKLGTEMRAYFESQNLPRPRVVCLEWMDPLMTAGNWIPELVEAAGGESVFGVVGQHSPYLKPEDLIAADPDVIAVMPCGFDLKRTHSEASVLAQIEGWSALKAVKQGQVFFFDANLYWTRPGPRIAESAEMLAACFRTCHFGRPK